MLDTNNTDYFDLSGMMIYDPVIGNSNVQETVPLVQFTECKWLSVIRQLPRGLAKD